jgi:hypothetical protein
VSAGGEPPLPETAGSEPLLPPFGTSGNALLLPPVAGGDAVALTTDWMLTMSKFVVRNCAGLSRNFSFFPPAIPTSLGGKN